MKTRAIIAGSLSALILLGLSWTVLTDDSSELSANGTMMQEDKTVWAIATFAGGCFWCMEPPFDAMDGVKSTVSGYTGGHLDNPTYEQVSSGGTGHYEAIRIEFDPEKVSYPELLEVFWVNIDPTDGAGQFCDRGDQYRSAIFYHTEEQREAAHASKKALKESGRLSKSVVTPIEAASTFYAAEDYHQDYYKKNPIRYKFYRTGCGRDRVLKKLWAN